jgi:hypothetical protein
MQAAEHLVPVQSQLGLLPTRFAVKLTAMVSGDANLFVNL